MFWWKRSLCRDRDAQVSAGHLLGQAELEQVQQRRRDVAQRAVGAETIVRSVFGDVDHGHRVGGMRRVRAAGDGIDHQLGVAVVGGDEPASVSFLDGFVDAAELRVDGLDGADGRLEFAGVAHHVGVGEVGDHQVECGVVDGFHDGVADAFGLHLGREIVGRHLERGNQRAVFAGERLLDAAVEEVRDVRKLFRLGDAQVAEIVRRKNVRQNVVHRFRQNDRAATRKACRTASCTGSAGSSESRCAESSASSGFPAVEIAAALLVESAFAGEHARDLAGAVGAEVEVDADIFVANLSDGLAGAVDDDERNEELVGDAVVVVLLDARDGIGIGAAFGFAVDHRVEGFALALPALVAIHRVVAAVDAWRLCPRRTRASSARAWRCSRRRSRVRCRGRP